MTDVCRHVVVPAAGVGRRMGGEVPKQYLTLGGRAIIEYVLERFAASDLIASITVVVGPDDSVWPDLRERFLSRWPGVRLFEAAGGKERCHSVLNGLTSVAARAHENDWVLVHDAARPCLSESDLATLCRVLDDDPVGGILAVPVRDTLKRMMPGSEDVSGSATIETTVPRDGLWQAQTPQMFRLGVLMAALAAAIDRGVVVTDEAQAVEQLGKPTRLVPGSADNLKVTHPSDLATAEATLVSQGLIHRESISRAPDVKEAEA